MKPYKTDWEALKKLDEKDIEQRALSDPDAQPTDEAFWQDAVVMMPIETVFASEVIALEPYVLDFFKAADAGNYPQKINALLHAYVDQQTQQKLKH